jgi:hypothetical protein
MSCGCDITDPKFPQFCERETVLSLLREHDLIDNESEGVSLLACLQMYDDTHPPLPHLPTEVLATLLAACGHGIDWLIDPPQEVGE